MSSVAISKRCSADMVKGAGAEAENPCMENSAGRAK